MKRKKKRVDVGASTLSNNLVKSLESNSRDFFPESQLTRYKIKVSDLSPIEGQAPIRASVSVELNDELSFKNIRIAECRCSGVTVILPQYVQYIHDKELKKQICGAVEVAWFQFREAGT